jgi:addiction module RelE/StbE family toxin
MKISFSSSFKKAYKKRIKGNSYLENKFKECLTLFIKNPYDGRLKTHKLSGKLKNLWSFKVDYDLRVIFYFHDDNHAVFVDIGKHDEVY